RRGRCSAVFRKYPGSERDPSLVSAICGRWCVLRKLAPYPAHFPFRLLQPSKVVRPSILDRFPGVCLRAEHSDSVPGCLWEGAYDFYRDYICHRAFACVGADALWCRSVVGGGSAGLVAQIGTSPSAEGTVPLEPVLRTHRAEMRANICE